VQKPSIVSLDPSEAQRNNMTPLSEQPLLVNMEHLSEIMNCDEELKRELVELYLRQTTEDLGKLKEAFAMQNSEEVKRFAHRMVGGSAACGMITLVYPLRELECLTEAGNFSKIPPVLMKVENEFKRICIFLRQLISPSNI
jgi:HPt (histidine-containing phosphotransfer) domain-containing protein